MASRWDLANTWDNGNDHGLFSNGDEPGVARWSPRPAFYYLYFFQNFLGDRFINSAVSGANANIDTYASTFSSGQLSLTLVNRNASAQTVQLSFKNFKAGNRFYWYELIGGATSAGYSRQVYVNGQGPTGIAGGPGDYKSVKAYSASALNGIKIELPAMSVVCLAVDKK
jgi:hypothetical protein